VLITDAELAGGSHRDIRIEGDRIAAIGPKLARTAGEPVLAAGGAAVLPGLHDHHIHLYALAAAESSLRCGPPEVRNADELAATLATASPDPPWIRGVGYHESVAGELDRDRLDALAPDRPVRIQHRSGALWVLNSAGAARVGLDAAGDVHGIERDAQGRATGRLFRLDGWLRERIDGAGPPDLGPVSGRLASLGVTGVTDATASNGPEALTTLSAAVDRGELLQRLLLLGSAELPEAAHPRVTTGAVKLLLDERDLPGFEELEQRIRAAHDRGRPVAIHCVTRAELVLASAALEAAGSLAGDRIEHAAVAPPDALPRLTALGVTVVTQPHFIRERGDAYLKEVEPGDRKWLYRSRGLIEAGIGVGGGSDAPFGGCDPWAAMRAAVDRRSAAGASLGPAERLSPERALALFTSAPEAPGGPPRRVTVGAPADLCVLRTPWVEARRKLCGEGVAAVLAAGRLVGAAA
jgi:predicted amidohydrolase YtcJ